MTLLALKGASESTLFMVMTAVNTEDSLFNEKKLGAA